MARFAGRKFRIDWTGDASNEIIIIHAREGGEFLVRYKRGKRIKELRLTMNEYRKFKRYERAYAYDMKTNELQEIYLVKYVPFKDDKDLCEIVGKTITVSNYGGRFKSTRTFCICGLFKDEEIGNFVLTTEKQAFKDRAFGSKVSINKKRLKELLKKGKVSYKMISGYPRTIKIVEPTNN